MDSRPCALSTLPGPSGQSGDLGPGASLMSSPPDHSASICWRGFEAVSQACPRYRSEGAVSSCKPCLPFLSVQRPSPRVARTGCGGEPGVTWELLRGRPQPGTPCRLSWLAGLREESQARALRAQLLVAEPLATGAERRWSGGRDDCRVSRDDCRVSRRGLER